MWNAAVLDHRARMSVGLAVESAPPMSVPPLGTAPGPIRCWPAADGRYAVLDYACFEGDADWSLPDAALVQRARADLGRMGAGASDEGGGDRRATMPRGTAVRSGARQEPVQRTTGTGAALPHAPPARRRRPASRNGVRRGRHGGLHPGRADRSRLAQGCTTNRRSRAHREGSPRGLRSCGPGQAERKSIATPLMQWRLPVGLGPSLKMCPRCPPQSAQWTSVRGTPIL